MAGDYTLGEIKTSKYIKVIDGTNSLHETDEALMIDEIWDGGVHVKSGGVIVNHYLEDNFVPATKEEYEKWQMMRSLK